MDGRAPEATYSERLLELGVDVTQLLVDGGGTIAPPTSRALAAVAQLPRLVCDDEAGGPSALVLGETLGEGGRGVVKRAYDPAVGRDVALKLVPTGAPPGSAVELLREARIAGRLAHPNIVPVYALGRRQDGSPAMVMKQIVGRRWSDILAGDDASLSDHLGILLQVCHAVAFAHRHGMVHRDLKPSNVMVGEFGEVYVLDWGLAVTLADDPDKLLPRAADIAEIAGTPGYMAPEMAAAEGASIDERTDVYLLGAILHELLTGRPPHERKTLGEALLASFASEPPVFDSSVPEELAQVCRRALEREPARRHADVVSFRDAIRAYLSHQASRALQQQALERVMEFERLLESPKSAAPEELHNLAIEARFGFRQALREWPDNRDAARGLERLLEQVVRWELARGNRDAAAALMGELRQPPAALLAALRELEASLAERHARLSRLEREADPTLQARERTHLSLWLAAGVALICLGLAALRLHATLGYPVLFSSLAMLALLLGFGWLRIRHGPGRALSGRFAGSIAVTIAALAVYLLASLLAGVSSDATFPTMMLIIATSCAVASVTLHRGFALSAVVYLASFAAMHAWPELTMWAFGLGQVLGFGSMGAVWMRAAWRAGVPRG